ncbi:MAG TPA: MFS transporter, partial [Rugosimonospora sp.]|nr:MFS transporter [Rugosimonospora sp.]
LSILFSIVTGKILSALTDAMNHDKAFQAAFGPYQGVLGGLKGNASLNDTSFINKLPAVVAHPIKVGFSNSMTEVFLFAAAILVIGLVVIAFLPELPLRTQSAVQARVEEDAEAAAAASD